MKVIEILRRLANTKKENIADLIETITIQNYGSNELTETDMWIIRNAAENIEYLERKLKESELTLDPEAPAEDSEELSLDEPSDDGSGLSLDAPAEDSEELSLDEPSDDGSGLSLDAPAEDSEELSLDAPSDDGGDELSLDDDGSEKKEEKPEIETSVEGAGILPLLAEIQDKLANGKPSEMELAALKAMKKLF